MPTQQLYEIERATIPDKESDLITPMPDYGDVASRFKRIRPKKQPTSIQDVEVTDKTTSDGKPFLIYDSKDKNRILIFASPSGLKMLSESSKWHADGTFHTKSKYFRKFYKVKFCKFT